MKETTAVGYHKYEFDEFGVVIEFTRFKPERGDIYAYIQVNADINHHPDMEHPHVMLQKQNLSSGNAKRTLANDLNDRLSLGKSTWMSIVETVCTRSIRTNWKGAEIQKIGKNPRRKEMPYLLYPVIRKDAPCIIYGTGGIGKSYVSLFFCLLVQENLSVGKLAPTKTKVLYLDWESGDDDLNDRVAALNKGLGIDVELDYRRCFDTLTNDIHELARVITTGDYGLVVVDAKGAAIGGQINEAKETIEMFNALRSLNITSLIIDHVSKESNSGPIGSIYNMNEARNVWEMRASQQEDSDFSRIGLYHRKTNVGKRHKPFGLEFKFLDDDYDVIDTVWVSEVDVNEDTELRKGSNMPDQIEAVLADNTQSNMDGTYGYAPMSVEDIHMRVGSKSLDSTRTRLSDKKFNNVRWRRDKPEHYVYIPDSERVEESVKW
jgi:hypothetical protein